MTTAGVSNLTLFRLINRKARLREYRKDLPEDYFLSEMHKLKELSRTIVTRARQAGELKELHSKCKNIRIERRLRKLALASKYPLLFN